MPRSWVGDFNALENFDEITTLTLPTDGREPLFQDTFRYRNPDSDGFTIDREKNTIVKSREPSGRFEGSTRIDYIFLRPPHGIGGVVLDEPDRESGESLSDHFGVLSELELA